MENTTSPAKIEANRRNAQKSTGPKTDKGKAIAKRNALKHGLLAREVVVTEGNAKESPKEFRALLEALLQDLAPAGPLEEMLVERIAVCYWRLRRVLIAEGGEINLRKDVKWTRWWVGKVEGFVELRDGCYHPESKFLRTVHGCEYVIGLLDELHGDVETQGELTEGALTYMKERLEDDGDTIGALQIFFAMLSDNPEKLDPEALKAKHKRITLDFLDSRKAAVRAMMEARKETEDWEESAKARAAYLPSEEAMERLSRYEAHLERQLYRALNQLERLQRQRHGEAVPPPLSVEVGVPG